MQSWSIDVATHDYVIDNQTPANLRADLNNALQAIVTQNSGSSAPTTTFSNMLWYDTANNQIKKRNAADTDPWITLGTIDEATGKFTPNAAITTSEIAAATLVTSTDTIATNDNDTTIPTSAAVKDYADSVTTTSAILSSTAGASAGAIGTYAWGGQLAGSYGFGTLVAGSNIVLGAFAHESFRDAGAAANTYGHGQTLSGTWRCMGRADIGAGGRYSATLWLRVS
jgi:hypothetical protein